MGRKDPIDETSVPAESAAPSEQTFALLELAQRHGLVIAFDKTQHRFQAIDQHDAPYKADHLVADVRHGWKLSESRTHEAVKLSDADYLAAVEAAKLGKTHGPANKRASEKAGE